MSPNTLVWVCKLCGNVMPLLAENNLYGLPPGTVICVRCAGRYHDVHPQTMLDASRGKEDSDATAEN